MRRASLTRLVEDGGSKYGPCCAVGWASARSNYQGDDPVPVGVFSIETANGSTFNEYYSSKISSTLNPSGLLYSTESLFDKARVAITGDASGHWTVIEKHGHL